MCATVDSLSGRMEMARRRGEKGVAERRTEDTDRLEYLASMIAELRAMADASRLPTLIYFLDMAHMEARDSLLRETGSAAAGDKRDAVA